MSGDVQAFPSGLLSLLAIQSGDGRGPSFLPPELQGILELIPYYTAGKRESVAGSGTAVNTAGTAVGLVVPASEWWLVEEIQGSTVAGAGAQLMDFCIGYQLINGAALNVLAVGTPRTSAAINEQNRVAFWSANRLIVPPGGSLVAQLLFNVAAGSITMNVSAVITRLRA